MNIKIKCPECGADVTLTEERAFESCRKIDLSGTSMVFLDCDCCSDCSVVSSYGTDYKKLSIQALNRWVEKYGCDTMSIDD